jgi:hypothetical protein
LWNGGNSRSKNIKILEMEKMKMKNKYEENKSRPDLRFVSHCGNEIN